VDISEVAKRSGVPASTLRFYEEKRLIVSTGRSGLRRTFDADVLERLDTFGFNRLCVYRGTPLWKEYVERGLVDEANDWYKYFKCSEIDPTCLPGEAINAERTAGLRRLFRYKLTHYPIQTFRLLRRFMRYMRFRDVVYLIIKPFLGQKQGPTKMRCCRAPSSMAR